MGTATQSRATRTHHHAVSGLTAVVLVALLCPCAARALPESFTAHFAMSAQGITIARSQWKLEPAGGDVFVYTTQSESVGIAKLLRNEKVEERSRFSVSGSDLRPLGYHYLRSRGKRKREADVRFDWDGGQGLNTINGETWTMALEPGVQDKLSYMFAIMLAMEKQGSPPPSITLSDGGKVKTYQLALIGHEQRETGLGKLETAHIKRSTADDPRVTHIWLAPSLGFLPVHIEHHEDGETATITLESLEGMQGN